jgi:putative transposase
MLQSLVIRLETTENDKTRLLENMRKYNEACNFVADKAYELRLSNKYKLHKLVYGQIRKHFGLTAQFAVRVIGKVVEAYKRDKSIKPSFRELGAIQYDQRNSKVGIDRVSLMTLQGRIKLATRIGDYQRGRFDIDRVKGQSDMIYRKGVFYLIVVVDAPEKPEYDPIDALGIDLGIENIAVDSDRQIIEGKKVEQTRKKYSRLRSQLQKVGTRSGKRKLKKVSGRERRFKKDTNHMISKAIVLKARGTTRAVGMEDLKYIRSRATVKDRRRSQRDRYSKWAFGELRNFVTYKAKKEGVPLRVVESKNTSRQCPECKHIDQRNRKSRNEFECLQCQYKEMADYVAALNIAAKARAWAAVNQPIVAETLISSYKPPPCFSGCS